MKHGVGWVIPPQTTALTGVSHGAAGIGWALLELAAISGEARFRKTAMEAMAYERSLFSPEARNWPDLRRLDDSDQVQTGSAPRFLAAWCHGAAGIGLVRLRALRHVSDPEIRTEINAAVSATLAEGSRWNDSLCHGDLGNVELLLEAHRTLGYPERNQLDSVVARILASIDQLGWRCANGLNVESPGLMTGLAGIGYGLLRLAEPDQVPSVLTLEPPKRSS